MAALLKQYSGCDTAAFPLHRPCLVCRRTRVMLCIGELAPEPNPRKAHRWDWVVHSRPTLCCWCGVPCTLIAVWAGPTMSVVAGSQSARWASVQRQRGGEAVPLRFSLALCLLLTPGTPSAS